MFSSDKDAQAQYHGLIKGLDFMDLKNTESNVLVLIGDCGNHPITMIVTMLNIILIKLWNYYVNIQLI